MKHAAYCGTRNIYADMETAAKSLIAMSDVDVVHFVIEDAEFPSELPPIVRVHDASGQTFFAPDGPNMASGYTYMAMMRLALCHVLPRVNKVLSLDADTVCMDDVSGVWDMPVDGCYFSAAAEWHRSGNGLLYTNAGVTDESVDLLLRERALARLGSCATARPTSASPCSTRAATRGWSRTSATTSARGASTTCPASTTPTGGPTSTRPARASSTSRAWPVTDGLATRASRDGATRHGTR